MSHIAIPLWFHNPFLTQQPRETAQWAPLCSLVMFM